MEIKDLINKDASWLSNEGPNSDIVISSRVRLARNLENVPFRGWAKLEQEQKLVSDLKAILSDSLYLKNSMYVDMLKLNETERFFLVERHLISREHAEYHGPRGVFISEGETLSVMTNEEDHLRMQSMFSGLQLVEAWRLADQLDSELQKNVKFAFSNQWGYLTACPTNVGTGMRASVMIHLPCLVLTKQIGKVLEAVSKLGIAVRGLYGEGTAAIGDFFQISNQITLGLSEDDIVDNMQRICKQILNHETNARNILYSKERARLEDRVWRAFGVLDNVRIVSFNEAIQLFSSIRLGISLGIIKNINKKQLNELFLLTQPAHLVFLENKNLSPDQRDVKRAELIREKLKK
ncbi:protein arginine kinase [bacterium]|nr:protein arginine kinase [bacterium]